MPSPTTDTRVLRRGSILLVISVFQFWLWGTRVFNLLDDTADYTVGFVVVHLLLFGAAFGMAAVLGVMGWRMRRENQAGGA